MTSAGADTELGHSYTRGRTAPSLVGRWPGGGGRIPFGPYTWLQVGVFLGSIVVLAKTYQWWAMFGPLNLILAVGVPIGLTFAVRYTRIEGRTPLRYAAGLALYLSQHRGGYLAGRPYRRPRPVRLGGECVLGGLSEQASLELYGAEPHTAPPVAAPARPVAAPPAPPTPSVTAATTRAALPAPPTGTQPPGPRPAPASNLAALLQLAHAQHRPADAATPTVGGARGAGQAALDPLTLAS